MSSGRSDGLGEFATLAGLSDDERAKVRLGLRASVNLFEEQGWPLEWQAYRRSATKRIENAQRRYGAGSSRARAARSLADGLVAEARAVHKAVYVPLAQKYLEAESLYYEAEALRRSGRSLPDKPSARSIWIMSAARRDELRSQLTWLKEAALAEEDEISDHPDGRYTWLDIPRRDGSGESRAYRDDESELAGALAVHATAIGELPALEEEGDQDALAIEDTNWIEPSQSWDDETYSADRRSMVRMAIPSAPVDNEVIRSSLNCIMPPTGNDPHAPMDDHTATCDGLEALPPTGDVERDTILKKQNDRLREAWSAFGDAWRADREKVKWIARASRVEAGPLAWQVSAPKASKLRAFHWSGSIWEGSYPKIGFVESFDCRGSSVPHRGTISVKLPVSIPPEVRKRLRQCLVLGTTREGQHKWRNSTPTRDSGRVVESPQLPDVHSLDDYLAAAHSCFGSPDKRTVSNERGSPMWLTVWTELLAMQPAGETKPVDSAKGFYRYWELMSDRKLEVAQHVLRSNHRSEGPYYQPSRSATRNDSFKCRARTAFASMGKYPDWYKLNRAQLNFPPSYLPMRPEFHAADINSPNEIFSRLSISERYSNAAARLVARNQSLERAALERSEFTKAVAWRDRAAERLWEALDEMLTLPVRSPIDPDSVAAEPTSVKMPTHVRKPLKFWSAWHLRRWQKG